ncbi:MAG: GreA/GreB family elongation factor, partial [Chloroflexota bacterium]
PGSRRNRVGVGCGVLLQNQDGKMEQYTIVGKAEADPIEGKISNESLVGKALLGKKAGDTVKVNTPAGLLKLSVLEIT